MPKFCVKKPYTVLVAVIMVLVLGFVSFTGMRTELLPGISLPYLMVITTYPGASPERVESGVTIPLESALGTVNGVENVSSTSAENYSMITLEFEDGTNMDSAMVKISSQIDQISGQLPEMAGTPIIMELSVDMMATMYISVDMDGMDIYQLSDFAKDNVIPYLERQNGVANVTSTGLVEKSVEIRLNQAKIDDVNDRLLIKVSDKLDEAKRELQKAQKEVNDGLDKMEDAQSQLDSGKKELQNQQENMGEMIGGLIDGLNDQISNLEKQIGSLGDQIRAAEAAMNIDGNMLASAKQTLRKYDPEYDETNMPHDINDAFAEVQIGEETMDKLQVMQNSIDRARNVLATDEELEKESQDYYWRNQYTLYNGLLDDETLTPEQRAEYTALRDEALQKLQDMELSGELRNTRDSLDAARQAKQLLTALKKQLTDLQAQLERLNQMRGQLQEALKSYEKNPLDPALGDMVSQLVFSGMNAQLGLGEFQLSAGKTQLESAKTQLESAWDQYNTAREEALKSANMDQLLNRTTISQMIMAQNFNMPAGYIHQGEDQYLLKVGDTFADVDDLKYALLADIDGIGEVRIKDIADVTVIDNAGDSYAKVNGNQAVMLSIFKSSTSGTSEVSENCLKAIKELEERYPGLRVTPLMNQGDYIKLVVNSVLSNLVEGAALAILVLLLFLKDFRPTAVVAISIPLSVLFAIVLMYFTGIELNIISLGGLGLGIGMLVDNSIVVIENIYRLRSRGVPAARAAVQGAKQVAGAVIASTLTTVCVFLPLVFASGLTRELLQDMGLTIGYSLVASLLVALSVVPATSSTLLKNCEEKKHPWFDKFTVWYGKVLRAFLRVKIVPLAVAIALLAFSVWQVVRMGIILIPDMGSNQVSVSISIPEETEDADCVEIADTALMRMAEIEGIDTVGGMSGGSGGILGGIGGGGEANFHRFTFYLMLTDDGAQELKRISDDIKAVTADLDCETNVSASSSDMTSMLSSGMQIDIYGNRLDTIIGISEDLMEMLGQVEGLEEIHNGQEDGDPEIHVIVHKDEAMRLGLTVAQVYAQLSQALTTSSTSTTLSIGEEDLEVNIVDENHTLNLDNLMNQEFTTTKMDDEGKSVKETHLLSEFASRSDGKSVERIRRINSSRSMSVTASTMEGYNTTLISREVSKLLEDYELPDGYSIEIAGESSMVNDMVIQMSKMISLALVFVYLVMVAQFQSLMSPFIVLFTIPLAFTGGLISLLLTGEQLSLMSLMGFLLLMGVVVNNGIVFVDYTNQLRIAGLEKRDALVATGITRMRPIFMTTLTTVLSMSVMAMSTDTAGQLSRGMAIVVIGGLMYATLMTLFIVPVMYDILYRKKEMKEVDVGDDLDDSLDEAAEFVKMQMALNIQENVEKNIHDEETSEYEEEPSQPEEEEAVEEPENHGDHWENFGAEMEE